MGRMEKVALTYIHTVLKIDGWREGAVKHREPSPLLCDDLERRGWGGEGAQHRGAWIRSVQFSSVA